MKQDQLKLFLLHSINFSGALLSSSGAPKQLPLPASIHQLYLSFGDSVMAKMKAFAQ